MVKYLALPVLGVKWLSIQHDGVLKAVLSEKSLHNVSSVLVLMHRTRQRQDSIAVNTIDTEVRVLGFEVS